MELAWAIVYVLLAIFAHALWLRASADGGSVVKFVIGGSVIGLVLIGHLVLLHATVERASAAVVFYAFACEMYLFLFTLAGTSISVRLLVALRDGGRTTRKIDQFNDSDDMVKRRLLRLVRGGLLREANGIYEVSPTGRRLVHLYELLQEWFCHAMSVADGNAKECYPGNRAREPRTASS